MSLLESTVELYDAYKAGYNRTIAEDAIAHLAQRHLSSDIPEIDRLKEVVRQTDRRYIKAGYYKAGTLVKRNFNGSWPEYAAFLRGESKALEKIKTATTQKESPKK